MVKSNHGIVMGFGYNTCKLAFDVERQNRTGPATEEHQKFA